MSHHFLLSYRNFFILLFLVLQLQTSFVLADSIQARCDIYPKGDDHSNVSIPCVFSQRQGYIYINRSDNCAIRSDNIQQRGY